MTIPRAPSNSTQPGTADLAPMVMSPPAWIAPTTAASGPTALATSLAPWANAMAQAVKIIRTAKTFSTLAKWNARSASSSTLMRASNAMPSNATTTPMAIESSRLCGVARSMPTCLRPLVKVIRDTMKPVRNMYTGTKRLAFIKGLSVFMINACTLMNRPKAITPDMKGVTTQLATMGPIAPQCTASAEMPTAAKPITAPTMEWVVETGQPRTEAINSQVPAA